MPSPSQMWDGPPDQHKDKKHGKAARRLLNAALDQPNPTPALLEAVNNVLTLTRHPKRDRSRDPSPAIHRGAP
ncbi:MAG: hypothetical protein OEO20_11360 [Gemmatimonadota bacterium]|nr:hypothetical protein [Gemmatimonadota bacterium]MDH3291599.1 hypothetical protein [Gemmatimonadota bacterium]MDH3366502.1 hypothetical protein [Gemmatimonadota bacterium]MDH3478891.1 hypothetical protein [Gemmatimonadota bacterium]MDH3571203.1 hypothetical protein [Gemmatimonadota bacterium]